MTLIFCILIGLVCGALVGAIDKLWRGENLIILTLSLVFGILGTVVTDRFIVFGPVLMGLDFLPVFIGGLLFSAFATVMYRQCIRIFGK